jgi:hypothetical protein
MGNFISRLINSADRTVEAHVVATLIAILLMCGISIYSVVWLGHVFDAASFGQGVGIALGGGGAAAWGQGMQRKSEEQGDAAPPAS